METGEEFPKLNTISDITWGRYAFSRDILYRKIEPDERDRMIREAIACGRETAIHMKKKYQTSDVWVIAEKMGLNVELTEFQQVGSRVLFALFTPPDLIQINSSIKNKSYQDLMLGHELFHCVEEETEEIYTKKEKIVLWKLFQYKNKSTIQALSEIAAMYFTKELNFYEDSPFKLDIILLSEYDSKAANHIYCEILQLEEQINHG